MMPGWISQVGGYIGIAVFLGAVVVYLRGSRDKGTITTLEQNNSALTERVALLEAGERRMIEEAKAAKILHAAEVQALTVRVEALEQENARLQSVRPSAEVLTEIASTTTAVKQQLEKHDADVKQLLVSGPGRGTT